MTCDLWAAGGLRFPRPGGRKEETGEAEREEKTGGSSSAHVPHENGGMGGGGRKAKNTGKRYALVEWEAHLAKLPGARE